jgi:class 3 adenylate cyclase/tetratricopeptide (TPR) repeat protein
MSAMNVSDWLHTNNFGRFADLFEENEIDGEVLLELTDADLESLGLPLGPRKKLIKAIAALAAGGVDGAEVATPVPAPTQEADTAEAERRQLTVMFVDLVGSTQLSGRLDPEEMREVITGYQNAVAGVVTRYEGHVAKYMGDGVLAYFGWPRAHEDDAERAVRTGLAIMQAMGEMTAPNGEALAARAGIATGLVVVGDLIGQGAAQEEAVVGETPNLAARLQGVASPGQVVVSESTRRLLGDVFELTDLGAQTLKGLAEEAAAFAIAGERAVESRFEARAASRLATIVGRDHELALMLERWKQAKAGEGQLILLSGEAGIGKSRLSRAMVDAVARDSHVRVSYQCSPYHRDSAFHPAIQQLNFAAGFRPGDSNERKLDRLEAVLPGGGAKLIAPLLGLDGAERYGPLGLSPQEQRSRTLEALAAQSIALSKEKPVLMVVEDAHWIDATTLELIDLCLDPVAAARVLILVTARPNFEHGFGGHPIVTRLTLNRLGREQIGDIITRLTGGKALPGELVDEIVAKTDGVPLFVEELTKTVLESGELEESEDAFTLVGPLSRLAIPATLHDSLMARLDRLQPVKEVAQTAACIGREFDYGLLKAILPLDDGPLQEALDRLVAAELVFRRGAGTEARYIFKHALVRDAAYESLLKARRRAIHEKMVAALESVPDTMPEVIAYHASEAGLIEKAIDYWQKAGQIALARPAYQEAISHLNTAIASIRTLTEDLAWWERELSLQIQLGQALMASAGYGAEPTAEAFARAKELVEKIGDTPNRFPVLYGAWAIHYIRAELDSAMTAAESFLDLAERQDGEVGRLVANRIYGTSLMMAGRLSEAEKRFEAALGFYRPDEHAPLAGRFGQEPGVAARIYQSIALSMIGFADRAASAAKVAEQAVRDLAHVNTTCYTAMHFVLLACIQRDSAALERQCRILGDTANQHGLHFWKAVDAVARGISLRGAGEGPESFSSAFASYLATGSNLFIPILSIETAKTLRGGGHLAEAKQYVRQAQDFHAKTGECWTEAETHRMVGDIARIEGDRAEAELGYRRAIEVAQMQEAKTWELRAATSLAGLLVETGERGQALDLLRPVHDWFTEGFDQPDLIDAKALLGELG